MFGGSMASLADPIPALACYRLFPGYTVWTRELQIDFRRPGTSGLELRFELTQSTIDDITRELAQRSRSTPLFEFGLYDQDERLVAWVKNRVAIRPRSDRVDEVRSLGDAETRQTNQGLSAGVR